METADHGRILRSGRIIPNHHAAISIIPNHHDATVSIIPTHHAAVPNAAAKKPPLVAWKDNQRVTKNEWIYSLVPSYLECPQFCYATACPCVMAYESATVLLRDTRTDSGTCYSNLLSIMICAPALFCMDRTATHGLNGLMQQHENNASLMMNSEDDEITPYHYSDLIYDALEMSGFDLKKRQKRGWTNDGKGFDIKEDISEDWWAAQWCSYYTYHSFCCHFLRCRTCNSAPYVPMCFAILCGGIYPICMCPATFVLRRSVINAHNISESCFDSALRSLVCTPCSLLQTYKEIHKTPFFTSLSTETPDVLNFM